MLMKWINKIKFNMMILIEVILYNHKFNNKCKNNKKNKININNNNYQKYYKLMKNLKQKL